MRNSAFVLIAFVVLLAPAGACAGGEPEFDRRTPVVVAVERTGPAVVNIAARRVVSSPLYGELPSELYWFFNIQPPSRELTSLGSGTIIHRRGYVLTNAHVVERADSITARTADGRSFEAQVVALNSSSDAALLLLEGTGPFPTAPLGTSRDLMVGETVIAVGNPFGLENTVTTGVVSAKRSLMLKEPRAAGDLIQTNAAINPGNSGGPLLNINGRVVGVNTMIKSDAEGVGFAIAIDRFKEELLQVLNEKSRGLWLGVDAREEFRATATGLRSARLVVRSVEKGSPAARAGLVSGDVIAAVNGRTCTDALLFKLDVLTMRVGDRLAIDYVRDGRSRRARVTLAEAPRVSAEQIVAERLGFVPGRLSTADAARLGVSTSYGVLVESVDAAGPAAGILAAEDIVLGVDRWRVRSSRDIAALIGEAESGSRTAITFVRVSEGARYYAELVLR